LSQATVGPLARSAIATNSLRSGEAHGTLAGGRSARHSNPPLYGKRQGDGSGRAIFLWWFPFFLRRRKTRKIRETGQK
jgi:hypothetical protein